MANACGLILKVEPIFRIGFAAISPVYAAVGNPLSYPSRTLYFSNLTDKLLHISFNGIDDNFDLPAAGYFVLDVAANKTAPALNFAAPQGQQFYVRCDAGPGVPTAGTFNITSFYGSAE